MECQSDLLGDTPSEVSLFSMHFYMDVFVCSCKMECQSDLLGWFPSEVSLSQCILYCCSLSLFWFRCNWQMHFIHNSNILGLSISLLIKNGRF